MSFTRVHPRSIASLFLSSITLFGVISIAALAIARLEHLQPETSVFSPVVFGQLMALHRVLLQYFVVLPALTGIVGLAMLPKVSGRQQLAFPRLGLLSWGLFTMAGLMVLWASLGAAVDSRWAFLAMYQPSAQPGSEVFLIGLAVASLAIGLLAINLLVSIQTATSRPAPTLATCLSGACTLQILALPLVGSALILALCVQLGQVKPIAPGIGDDTGLIALLAALAARPLKVSVLLAAMGVSTQLLSHDAAPTAGHEKRIRVYVIALVIASLFAFETRFSAGMLTPRAVMAASFFNVLMMLPLCALMFTLFSGHLRRRPAPTTPRLYAAAVAVLIFLLAPVDVILSLPAMHALSDGALTSSTHYLLIFGSAMLALMGALHHLAVNNRRAGKGIALCILVGLAAMILPMIPLGLSGVSMDFATYPKQMQPLQVMSTYGGLILALGLIAGILQISGHSLRRWASS